ncbi:DUF4192 domain-containing protein [Arthrobacter sp. AK01]|uniref:DUF4192 domain-containing protein n=1 Tax=Micrococcaceae TaxID=1268 RepID=UPI001E65D13B|nr:MULTISPECIES: DUF4192 domain-containing protein [Micrococcaceae]MCD4850078.1 DUF4192 domain-containing protein [Arthrobacter sp. AK01]MCP1413486.1 hypothetical protein [Paenarthrobacter sp. A20]
MTTNETLSIHQPEDILGYIPHTLGYWPEDSLVAITMQGNVLGATLRVDLPFRTTAQALACFAVQIRRYLEADEEADGVVLAVYTDAGWEDGDVVHRMMPMLKALQEDLERVGMPMRDAWLVGSEYWRSAYCSDEGCCPLPGLPVARIKDSRLSAELVYRGSALGPSPKGKPGIPKLTRTGALDPLVLEAESRYGERILGMWRSEGCLEAVLTVWKHVLDVAGPNGPLHPGPDAELMGFLRTTLKVPAWRDAVVVMAAAGIESARSGAHAFGLFTADDTDATVFDPRELGVATHGVAPPVPGPEDSNAPGNVFTYGDILLGMQPDKPSWNHLDQLQQVLAGLCVEGESGEVAAAAFTLQGWISWCKGSGSMAHASLIQAEAAQPGYRLAGLLMEVLGRGAVCPWARQPGSAWRGYKDANA